MPDTRQAFSRLLKKSRCERFVSWHDFSRADKSFIFVIPSGLQPARDLLFRPFSTLLKYVGSPRCENTELRPKFRARARG